MSTPTQRHTSSRRDRRRSHHALKKQNFASCSKCKEPVISHTTCPSCGYYKGKEVIDVLARVNKKKEKKKKEDK